MIAMASRILSSRKSGKICMSLRMSGNVMKEMIKKCLWPITEISLIEKINNISPRFSSKKKVHLWQVPEKKKSGLWVLQGPANRAMWRWRASQEVVLELRCGGGCNHGLPRRKGRESSAGSGKHMPQKETMNTRIWEKGVVKSSERGRGWPGIRQEPGCVKDFLCFKIRFACEITGCRVDGWEGARGAAEQPVRWLWH